MKNIIVSIFLLVSIIAFDACNSKPAVDTQISLYITHTNKMCPLVIDQITRLDSAKAFPDHTIKHYYTLNTSKENVDLNMLKENVIKNTINEIQNNPQLKPFKGEKITYIQIYSDKDGNEISTITVKPEDYEKAQ